MTGRPLPDNPDFEQAVRDASSRIARIRAVTLFRCFMVSLRNGSASSLPQSGGKCKTKEKLKKAVDKTGIIR
jgi:hypothetical protein